MYLLACLSILSNFENPSENFFRMLAACIQITKAAYEKLKDPIHPQAIPSGIYN
jgi:hypothetical protein